MVERPLTAFLTGLGHLKTIPDFQKAVFSRWTSSGFRSSLVRLKNFATSEPDAPAIMMMGPSAPNGQPDPIEMADDSGFVALTSSRMG